MKKLILIFLPFFTFINTKAQMPNTIIELKADTVFSDLNFSIIDIIDERITKENVGYVSRGLGSNNSKIVFKDNSPGHLKEMIRALNTNTNPNRVTLIIRNLTVSEDIGTINLYGYCNLELEFALQEDSNLYSLGIYYSNIVENHQRVKYTHPDRIIDAFYDCFRQFNNTNWQNINRQIVRDVQENIEFDYKSLPPIGAYLNYNQMKRKTPFDTTLFNIKPARQSKKFVIYNIEFRELLNPLTVNFYCDGKAIYMRANKSLFFKSESFGKYIYFQGRISTTPGKTDINEPPKSIKNPYQDRSNATGSYTAAFGLVGLGIYSLYSNNANTSIKGVVINTETEKLKFVTDMFLYRITKKSPDILKKYRKSRRKLEDKKNIIIELNSKYQD